jgi:hypothetical protein
MDGDTVRDAGRGRKTKPQYAREEQIVIIPASLIVPRGKLLSYIAYKDRPVPSVSWTLVWCPENVLR